MEYGPHLACTMHPGLTALDAINAPHAALTPSLHTHAVCKYCNLRQAAFPPGCSGQLDW